MKRFINVSLYVIIFLLIVSICIISIKKFVDGRQVKNLCSTNVVNSISNFVSFNKIMGKEEGQEIVIKEEINKTLQSEEKKETINIETEEKETIKLEEKEENQEYEKNDENDSGESIILFDGLNEKELSVRLETHLKNELSGTSLNFIDFYKTYGMDPYLSVAIVLHETGCSWTCSSLAKECYNYGGITGGESKYKETNYACYSSKEEGINAYLNMLYNTYYSKGLTTPELINPKYATSLEWSAAINRYINKIKNS